MNIKQIPPYLTNEVQNSSSATTNSGAQGKAVTGTTGSSDRVQLSQNYQDLASAQKTVTGSNEIRTDKVQQIKDQLQSGTYQVDPDDIANKMLDEII
jgi:negative regulator of flagellin synthesis FlgM